MTSRNDASNPIFARKLLRPLIKASATLLASTHLALCRGPNPYINRDAQLAQDAAADGTATDGTASSDAAPTEDRVEPQDAPGSDSESADGQSEDGSGSDGR